MTKIFKFNIQDVNGGIFVSICFALFFFSGCSQSTKIQTIHKLDKKDFIKKFDPIKKPFIVDDVFFNNTSLEKFLDYEDIKKYFADENGALIKINKAYESSINGTSFFAIGRLNFGVNSFGLIFRMNENYLLMGLISETVYMVVYENENTLPEGLINIGYRSNYFFDEAAQQPISSIFFSDECLAIYSLSEGNYTINYAEYFSKRELEGDCISDTLSWMDVDSTNQRIASSYSFDYTFFQETANLVPFNLYTIPSINSIILNQYSSDSNTKIAYLDKIIIEKNTHALFLEVNKKQVNNLVEKTILCLIIKNNKFKTCNEIACLNSVGKQIIKYKQAYLSNLNGKLEIKTITTGGSVEILKF